MTAMSLLRRDFITFGIAGAAGCLARSAAADSARRRPDLPVPTKAQMAWQDAELGVIFHYDLPIAASVFARDNMVRKKLDPSLYNPPSLNTDQWLDAAKAAGARYAVFTATHFNGFLQWQSDLYPYGVKQAAWRNGRGDVVADFVTSCRQAGIRPALYLSTHRNAYWSVWGHYVDFGKGRGTPKQQEFNRTAERMTEELCSRYGPLIQIWFDAGVKTPEEGGPDVLPIFEKHQPESVFYHSTRRSDHRWIGNESGFAGDPCWATMPSGEGRLSHNSPEWRAYLRAGIPLLLTGDPEGASWAPGMVDVPLRGAGGVHSWLWMPNQEHACHSVSALLKMYDNSVGRNCNFVIGAVVAPDGSVPAPDVARLREFGRALADREARVVASTLGTGEILELDLGTIRPVDRLRIMEDIAGGERVRVYSIEGKNASGEWLTLGSGQSIGHKRIVSFPEVRISKVRLRVIEARGTPQLREFAAYAAPSS